MSHRRQSASTLKKITPLVMLLLAFALQMRYLSELREAFPGSFTTQPFCGVDAAAHLERAVGLLNGAEPGQYTFYFIPFYPVYLALLKLFLGDSLLLPVFMQAGLQLVGMAALYRLGRVTFSPLTGALAALSLATYNYYLFYLPCYDQTLITTPCLTLAVCAVVLYSHRQKSGYLGLAGAALAGAILSRPTILVLLPVLIIWLYVTLKQDKLPARVFWRLWAARIMLLTLPFVIAVAPITWHNYRVSGRFILLSDNLGVNLFTGNNPDATGLDSLAHIQSQPAVLRFEEIMNKGGESALSAEAWRYILTQPGDWLALMARKTWLWFGEVDERLMAPYFPSMVSRSATLAMLPVNWQAAVITALLGLLLTPIPREARQRVYLLWLIYGVLSAASILFFIDLRFRLPFVPFVLLLAASLLGSAPTLRRRYPWRFWTALAVMLGLYPLVPGLWIFMLLLAGLGLRPKKLLFVVCLYLLVVGLWVKAEALASDVSQSLDHYLGPPLAATGTLGQTFQMDCNGLKRIDVTLGVFKNRPHTQPVTFYLATDISAQNILFSETFDGHSVQDYQQKSFSFPPIPDSAGRAYFFFLASPASTPDNALTVRGYSDTPVDRYPAGNAWAGQVGSLQKREADFAFTAYCQLTLWQKLQALVTNAIVSTP